MRITPMRTSILLSALNAWACSTPATVKLEPSPAAEVAPPPSAPLPPPAPPQHSTVLLSSFAAYSNLMPRVVGPGMGHSDPMITVWNLEVEGSEPVVVEQAVLSVQSAPPLKLRIDVDEPRVDPRGGKVSVQQCAKGYEGARFPAGADPCTDKPKTQLTLTLRVGSSLQTLTAEGEYHCVY